jgi:hypothetical protein
VLKVIPERTVENGLVLLNTEMLAQMLSAAPRSPAAVARRENLANNGGVVEEIGCMVVKCICIETLQCLVECVQRTVTCFSLPYDFSQKYFFDK